MTMLKHHDREWLNNHIEAYTDGELSAKELIRFNDIANADQHIFEDVRLARQIAASLRSVPVDQCPEHVRSGIMAHVRQDIRSSAWGRFQSFFLKLNVAHFRPALAVAMLFLVVLSSTQIGNPTKEPTAQVSQALDEVKWTLAFLSKVGRTTGTTVRSDVIEDQVIGPMSRSLTTRSGN